MNKYLVKLLDFIVTCILVRLWLAGVVAIPIFFFPDDINTANIFIIIYLFFSCLFYIYFKKKNKLEGDKSFKAVIRSYKSDFYNFFQEVKEFLKGLFSLVGNLIAIGLAIWGFISIFGWLFGGNDIDSDSYQKGNMINSGGTPTYRYNNTPFYDDNYYTSNNESNDQPVGFYGTDTMYACNGSSGNCYDLDVDSDGENIERIYFPKGGWVDVDYSDCDSGYCYVEDENGNEWELEY